MREAEAGSRRGARRPRLLLALMLTAVLIPLPRAEAFPNETWTLWELTQHSELVVWAEVEEVLELLPAKSIEENQRRARWQDCEVAHLRIRETWRGKARPGERIKVRFNSHIICPVAPPVYEPGQAVIAFLAQGDGAWRTVTHSMYGTRYPLNEDELAGYRRAVTRVRVAEEQAIVARAAGRESGVMAALTDWQVFVALHPATRWDGLYGLEPESDEGLSVWDSRRPRPAHLLPTHREQLARAFVEAPAVDRSLPMMLTVLRGHESAEVDHMAARALESILAKPPPPRAWVRGAFELLRERYGEKPLPRPEQPEDPPLLPQWQQFKQRHHLDPKRLPMPGEPVVSGTGAKTTL